MIGIFGDNFIPIAPRDFKPCHCNDFGAYPSALAGIEAIQRSCLRIMFRWNGFDIDGSFDLGARKLRMVNVDRKAEHELLLLCTQSPYDDHALSRVERLLKDPIDWTYLVETSLTHAVTPMLCRTLELIDPAQVPSDVLAAAKTHLAENGIRNKELTTELLRILDGLDRAGIPAVPFKGPALAETCYRDPAIRSYRDLDFLIAKDAAVETVKVLRSLGYAGTGEVSSISQDFKLSPRQDRALWHYAGEYLFFHSETNVAVEPHWAFVPPTFGLDPDYDAVLARARQGDLMGRAVRTLSPEDTVLSLALHGAKEYWARLQWISDLDRAIKYEAELDWNELLEVCRRFGGLRSLLVGLQLVRDAFGTELDKKVSSAIGNDRVAQKLAAERLNALFDKTPACHSNAVLSRDWFRMLTDLRTKIRYVCRTAITPRVQHFESLPLPDSLFPAYYAFKPAQDYVVLPLWVAANKLCGRRRGE